MRTVSLLIVLLLGALALNAGTIGPTCASCYGATYSLDGYLAASTPTTDDWVITYSINTAGYTGSASDYITSVALKVTSKLLGVKLASAPGSWNLAPLNTNQSNAGCSGNGNGWVCASTTDKSAAPVVGADNKSQLYSWIFDVTMAKNSLLSLASIQANYDPPTGLLVSEKVTVPEGNELPTLIVGVGLAFWFFRRTRATA